MSTNDKKWAIPMEIDKQADAELEIVHEDIVKMKLGCRMVDAVMVPCTEQQYRDYMRDVWKEEQNTQRSRKCMVRSEKTNKLIRCTKSCSECEQAKNLGAPLSLNAFEDDYEYEPEELTRASIKAYENSLTLMLIDELVQKLEQQSPELAVVFQMMLAGETQQAIGDAIGKPQQTTYDIIKRLRKQLQSEVSREDILS